MLAAAAGSHARLAELRRALVGAVPPGCAAFALGSLGRHESSALSDLDLAVVYRRGVLDPADAHGAREAVAAALRARPRRRRQDLPQRRRPRRPARRHRRPRRHQRSPHLPRPPAHRGRLAGWPRRRRRDRRAGVRRLHCRRDHPRPLPHLAE
ncbi:DUF294 nucleotidyltransferase-like domain-containing protein [Nannocystis pusilla]|uniref:DUF294 nucleotidyltransferase-like domain-containing protein n=1 Tax=Nannocystis pusilla TaxID=889268 RepID=UPI003B80100C